MARVFVSHRGDDVAEAKLLARTLADAGHDVRVDAWDLNIGDSIVAWMNDGLGSSRFLIMCYSASGFAPWMNREWMSALARQLNGENVKILPVKLTGGSPPAILADIKYADLLTDWNNGVNDLLKAIK